MTPDHKQWIPAQGSWVAYRSFVAWTARKPMRVDSHPSWTWRDGRIGEPERPGNYPHVMVVCPPKLDRWRAWLSDLRPCTPEELAQLALSPAGQLEGL